MGNFFIIYDRQEAGSNAVPEREGGPGKILPAKVRTGETTARWSGNPETAKVALIEASTAALAQRAALSLFGPTGGLNDRIVSIPEGEFREP